MSVLSNLYYSKVRNVKSPSRGTPGSAGIDFFVPEDLYFDISPSKSSLIPTGIKVNIPDGFALIAFNKSGVALKKGLIVGACVIDSDYQGEIHMHVINTTSEHVHIESGEKLVQFLLIPVSHTDPQEVNLDKLYERSTVRGSGGFGSTGLK
jgi:dUTP pyrophosphatase